MKTLSQQHGMALVLCLLIMTVLSAVGTSALMVASTNQKIASNYKMQTQAFNVSEAGTQFGLAQIKNSVIWRGSDPATGTASGSLGTGSYALTVYDSTNDANGLYDSTLPSGFVRLVSAGTFSGSTQRVETILELSPNEATAANIQEAAVITTGPNTGSGPMVVNGYDNDGNLNPSYVLANQPSLPAINGPAIEAMADFYYGGNLTTELPADVTNFFKDHPADTKPWITVVEGNLDVQGDEILYGIIYVKGQDVTLRGTVRVHGVIYAPNAVYTTDIRGGGSPGDQPVMGQVICGIGGVEARGNHADVQYVKDYADALRNLGGDITDVTVVSWKQG